MINPQRYKLLMIQVRYYVQKMFLEMSKVIHASAAPVILTNSAIGNQDIKEKLDVSKILKYREILMYSSPAKLSRLKNV